MKKLNIGEKQRESMRQNGLKSNAIRKANGFYSSELQSKRCRIRMENECKMADALTAEGYNVFSPTVVCDRIAVKDGIVYFVEFKKSGQKLRPGQQIVHDLVPEKYLIRYD